MMNWKYFVIGGHRGVRIYLSRVQGRQTPHFFDLNTSGDILDNFFFKANTIYKISSKLIYIYIYIYIYDVGFLRPQDFCARLRPKMPFLMRVSSKKRHYSETHLKNAILPIWCGSIQSPYHAESLQMLFFFEPPHPQNMKGVFLNLIIFHKKIEPPPPKKWRGFASFFAAIR